MPGRITRRGDSKEEKLSANCVPFHITSLSLGVLLQLLGARVRATPSQRLDHAYPHLMRRFGEGGGKRASVACRWERMT